MVDINKLREINAALQEGLISQEEYDKIKTNLIDDSNSTKAKLQNLLTDRSNSNSSVQTIPADGLQHLIINNNNNNNNNNANNSDGKGCYQNTAAHLLLSLVTGGGWLFIWLILAIFKI